jgi:prepilin-type N-terminal cleavage/methylation domain-containing protein
MILNNQKSFSDQQGFTLLELLITVLIAVILMGFAVPSFIETIEKRKVISLAEQISGHITQVRSDVISRSTNTYFKIATGNNWVYGLSSRPTDCNLATTTATGTDACTLVIDDGDTDLDPGDGSVDTGDLVLQRVAAASPSNMALTTETGFPVDTQLEFDSVRGTSDIGTITVTSHGEFTLKQVDSIWT